MTFDEHKARSTALLARHALARGTADTEAARLGECEARLEALVNARGVLQRVAQAVQQSAHDKIAAVVTRCLRSAGFPYEFLLRFERRRGKTECDLRFGLDGRELDPRDEGSGGAVDVAALGLRLACLMLTRPKARRLLVMDEPCKNVNGKVHQDRVCELLETLAREMSVQMVIVSDNWLRVGDVIRLGE